MKTVLALIDFSDITDRVLAAAAEQARFRQARLYIVHVAPPEADYIGFEPDLHNRDTTADRLRDLHRRVQQHADQLEADDLPVTPLLIQGPVPDKALDEAADLDADLIVVGSHGHSALYDMVVGSVTHAILHRTTRPVLVIPARTK